MTPLHSCSCCLDNSHLGGKWGTQKLRAGHPSDGFAVGQGAGRLWGTWGSSGHAEAAQAEALVGSKELNGDSWKILQVSKWGKGWKPLLWDDAKGTVLSETPFFVIIVKQRLAFV